MKDPQREHPNKLEYLYLRYKEELEYRGFRYVEIQGKMNERVSKAVSAINAL